MAVEVSSVITITWADLTEHHRLRDFDVIHVAQFNIHPEVIELQLRAGRFVTWRKGIEIRNDANDLLAFIETYDNRKVSRMARIFWNEVAVGGKLILGKAKLFGIYADMYWFSDLAHLKGKRTIVTWESDH